MNRLVAFVTAVVALLGAAPPPVESTAKLVIEDSTTGGDSQVFLQNASKSAWIEVTKTSGSQRIRRWTIESSSSKGMVLNMPDHPSWIQVLAPDGTAIFSETRGPDGGVPQGAERRKGTWIGDPFRTQGAARDQGW